jgi:Tol biopolymer transport system component
VSVLSPSTATWISGSRLRLGVIAAIALAIGSAASLAAEAGAGGATTELVSVDSHGVQPGRKSALPSISAAGRFVAFSTGARLARSDTNAGDTDVYVHDRSTGATRRVSVGSGGRQASGGEPAISADGRFVAFNSEATSLVRPDTNGDVDVFIHDRRTGRSRRVSSSSTGAQANMLSRSPAISADGRYVAFESNATNLVNEDTNRRRDIFVRDMTTGRTRRVSVSSAGAQGDGHSHAASISADGRLIAFTSDATNLVPEDTNGAADIFIHDWRAGKTTRVTLSSTGAEGESRSDSSAVSARGRFVAFASLAPNLVSGDTNETWDVFVRDRETGETSRVSVGLAGRESDARSGSVGISADGRTIAFTSAATNLVDGDINARRDVFVHDRRTSQTRRASVRSAGGQGNGSSTVPAISANGRFVAFASKAGNLVRRDTNLKKDVFVRGPLRGRAR